MDRVRCLEGLHGVKAMKVVQAHGRLEGMKVWKAYMGRKPWQAMKRLWKPDQYHEGCEGEYVWGGVGASR